MLLDTNIVIEVFRGDLKLSDFLDEQPVVYIPSIVLGELYLGANRSASPAKHLKKITNFVEKCVVLAIDNETARHYGQVKAALLKKGKPIPENDIWIASVAKQHELQLLTKDIHFKLISDIRLKYWPK